MSKLYSPIHFFDDEEPKKSQPANNSEFHHPIEDKDKRSEEKPFTEDYKPSFCYGLAPKDVPSSASPETNIPQYAPQVPLPAPYPAPAPFNLTIPIPLKKEEKETPNAPWEPRSAAPKAYDIAMELMAAQPLRMVDNALYAFDGQVYRFVSAPTMNRLIMHLCRSYVHAVGDASIIKRVYEIIQAEPNICMPPVSSVPMVALDDGLLDLTTLTLGPFSPTPFVTVKLYGSYTKGQAAMCPTFDTFLSDTTGGDPVLTERIWQVIGYSIVPDNSGKCFILFQGVPNSGKSLLGDIIASLVDDELVTSLDLNTLGERFGPSELVGKQLCLALDLPSGTLDAKATSMFKQLTGGDFVTADVKYQPRIKFRCTATFVLATNHSLLTRDPDPAFLQRTVVVPFRHSVDKDKQNRVLKFRILAERDAIIYRAIQAYARLRQANYQFAGEFMLNEVVSNQISASPNSLTDALHNFCNRVCFAKEGAFTPTSKLYQAFCDSIGTTWPGGIRSFSDEAFRVLCSLFPQQVTRDRKRPKGTNLNAERGFSGISLREVLQSEDTM